MPGTRHGLFVICRVIRNRNRKLASLPMASPPASGSNVALMQNVFARAEWEFIEFPNISDIRVSTNSVRVAVGLKF